MTYPFGAYICVVDVDVDTVLTSGLLFYAWTIAAPASIH